MAYFEWRDIALTTQAEGAAPGLYRNVFKRGIDLLSVAVLAIPVLTVVAVLAVFVARDGRSPFFFQKRVGRNGKTFRMIKLRSMVANADAVFESYLAENPEARREWDHKQKLSNDPRITKIGKLIRKTSLDELPQLWNVLVGDMSMVGPRPIMESQRSLYPGRSYYDMRPGITGLWQVSERNETSFAERAFYDNAYHSRLSLRSDLNVMARTVAVVFAATGQ